MKTAITLCVLILLSYNTNAQNTSGKNDDAARIVLATFVPQQIDNMPEAARSSLTNKLNQIVTQNGMGGKSINERFIITANINVISKDITPSAPPMYAYVLDITLFIGDGIEGIKFSSISFEVKGIGESETKAYISALKNLKTNDPKYQSFIETGKNKIIEYYNSKCDFNIKEAQTLASQNQFDEAIFKLSCVPEVCKDCYDKSMDAITVIFKAKMERECQSNIAKSKTFKAQENYDKAAEALATILPDLTCYKEAQTLMDEINDHKCAIALGNAKGAWASKDVESTGNALKNIPTDSKCYGEGVALAEEVRAWLKKKDDREWNFKMQEQKDEVAIAMSSINAAREIGVAYGKNQPKSVTYNIIGWR
jgi:hypothetical protein